MNQLKIYQRVQLISAIALIGFLAIGGLLFWEKSVRSANAERQHAALERLEKITSLSMLFLNARRREKDFLLRFDPKYIEKHSQVTAEIRATADGLTSNLSAPDREVLQKVTTKYAAYSTQFDTVVANWNRMGLDENSGLRGQLRAAVHNAEELIGEHASDDLMVKLLMMRRHEKDFIIRKDPKYIGRLNDRITEFGQILETKELSPKLKSNILETLQAYKTSFSGFTDLMLGIGEQTATMSDIYAQAEPLLASLEASMQASYESELAAVATANRQTVIVTSVLILIIAAACIAIAQIVGRSISRPVGALSAQMLKLAEGDKSVEVPINGKDEIAEMAQAVQVFKDNMIRNDRLQAESQARQQQELERAGHVESLTTSFDGDVGKLLDALSAASATLQSTSKEMTETAEDSGSRATAVASATEETTANVQTVATATTELSASIAEISSQVANATAVANDTARQAETTSSVIDELSEATGRIGEIVTLIREIAEQTNLLALNATIESARAGEAGKGFAVVASEVKNLAGQTGQATEDIAAQISAIQERTSGAVDAIRSIVVKVEEMENITGSIAAAVEEQNAATQDISRNIEDVAAAAQDVNQNVTFVSEASRNTSRMASDVFGASSEMNEKSSSLGQRIKDFLQSVRAA